MAAIKALQQWCKNQCDGYKDVAVTNMTTSFRDGLAFCALIHKFRPDLIDFDSLRKENIYDNNKLAFHVAEQHLGIPALLDAEDMVALSVPDRLSILTYVSQYYNYFHGRSPIGGLGGIGGGGGVKRPAEGSKEEPSEKKNLPVVAKTFNPKRTTENSPPALLGQRVSSPSPVPVKPVKQDVAAKKTEVLVESSNKTGTLNSKCAVCKAHVHLVQRHLVDGKLYHRSCFKCSDCSSTLIAGAYKAGTEPGTFLCKVNQNGCKSSQKSSLEPSPSPLPPSTSAAVSHKKAAEKPQGRAEPTSGGTQLKSALTTPVKVVNRPSETRLAAQPWTPSAQKTQAARQRFFQSSATALNTTSSKAATPSGPQPGPPSSVLATAASPSTSTPRESLSQRLTPGPGPSEAGSTQHRLLAKPEEKDRARALITKKLDEGNTNNNNIATQSRWKIDNNRSGSGLHSAEAPSWRLERRSQSPAGGTTTTITTPASRPFIITSTPSPAPGAPSSSSSSSSSTSKESFWLAAVKEKERTKVLPMSTSTAVASNAHSTTSIFSSSASSSSTAIASGERVNSTATSEAPADWRSKLKPVPKASTPSKAVEPSGGSSTSKDPLDPKPGVIQRASVSVDVTSPISQGGQASAAPTVTTTHTRKRLSVQEFQRRDSGDSGSTNGYSSGETVPTASAASPAKANHIPTYQILKELREIEMKLTELEREGVDLEKRLRSCEEDDGGDVLMDPLMVDWFNLIRKKQVYVRRESELVYIARTQDLEQEQPGVEGELRRLMDKPEHLKSERDRRRQAELLERLLEIVNDRNAIVEGLDQDRLREEEEDQQLNEMMQRLGVKKEKRSRQSSFSKLFRRKSSRAVAEG